MSDLQEVKRRTDIVDLVGKSVRLQKAGRIFKGLCPFHTEKTPSFIVNPDRQTWHCFGACSTGGDVISFVERSEGLSFREALEVLARAAGITLHDRGHERRDQEPLRRLQTLLARAAEYFHDRLMHGPEAQHALAYVTGRGADDEILARFLVGYAPEDGDVLRDELMSLGFRAQELVESGLYLEGAHLYPRFRNRLVFPLLDETGACAGFGGRSLDGSPPKYLNTPQSAVFDKGGMLYGLHLAKQAVREADRAVIVEGYMDVLATHQCGFENVVASMGTALTERQVALLKRYSKNIVMAMDADEAGLEAAQRSPQVVLGGDLPKPSLERMSSLGAALGRRHEVDLRIAPLPDGLDPDDLVRKNPEKWDILIRSALPWTEFLIDRALQRLDQGTARDVSRLVREVAPIIAAAGDAIEQAVYIQRLAARVGLPEETLTAGFARARPRTSGGPPPGQESRGDHLPGTEGADPTEDFLAALLLRYPEVDKEFQPDIERTFSSSLHRQILMAWRSRYDFEELRNDEDFAEEAARLEALRLPPLPLERAREAYTDCLGRLERRRLRELKLMQTQHLRELQQAPPDPALTGEGDASQGVNEDIDSQLIATMETGLALHKQEGVSGA